MSINITEELKTDFLVYAQEVNNNRAFPDVRDGLKISQRAVLWEMFDKKYFSNKPHVKSAKVDGGVIANWHPHGSEYSTIVRMSQPWVNNVSEIDFHGANGSLIGGPDAAASRYTECRLSKASEEGLFRGIEKNNVDFKLNYSEDEKWPSVFPALMPRLFINGSQGIGYTIAQEREPGNLKEFLEKLKEFLKKGKVDCSNIYPDYPTGGIIINKSEIHILYETGKGTVILRGKANIKENFIQITELPYQVYAEPFIQKIKDLVNSEILVGIEDVYNKSDDSGLLIEIECSADPKIVLNKLYKLTDLQVSLSANQIALVDGIPQNLTFCDYLNEYLKHNINCLKCEYQFDLDKATNRLEIVEGLLKALNKIDKIISTIKTSKSAELAKQNLIDIFKFTELQAKAIIDMKLGKLANLETTELKKEKIQLEEIIARCTEFLANTKLQQKELIKRLTDFTKEFGTERKTEVLDINLQEESSILKIEKTEEKYILILTKNNEIKKVNSEKFKKSADIINYIEVKAKDRFILISNTGKMYKLNVKDFNLVSQGSKGTSLKEILNDKIIKICTGYEPQEFIFMITKNGLAKKIKSEIIFNLSKCIGAPIMKVDSTDEIINCRLVNNEDQIDYKLGTKEKTLYIKDFLDKGRSAGGVVAIHLGKKLNNFELKKED